MRSPSVCAIALAIAIIFICQPVAALPVLQVPYFRAGPVWSLSPFEAADLVIQEFNTSRLAADNSAALAISFVPTGISAPGGFAASPVLTQTSSQTLVCERSYFYKDFLTTV